MLLQQLANIFLYARYAPPTTGHHTLGLHCSQEGCKEFLQCHAPSEGTCSCFLQTAPQTKAMKCPWTYVTLRVPIFSTLQMTTETVPLPANIQTEDSVTFVDTPGAGMTGVFVVESRCKENCYFLNIYMSPDETIDTDNTIASWDAKSFPLKVLMKPSSRWKQFIDRGYKVQGDVTMAFSRGLVHNCTLELLRNVSVYGGMEIP